MIRTARICAVLSLLIAVAAVIGLILLYHWGVDYLEDRSLG